MLILTRFVDQAIVIDGKDGPIKIMVTEAYGKVKLGIDAPRDVPVHRQEVYDAMKREREQTP